MGLQSENNWGAFVLLGKVFTQ